MEQNYSEKVRHKKRSKQTEMENERQKKLLIKSNGNCSFENFISLEVDEIAILFCLLSYSQEDGMR